MGRIWDRVKSLLGMGAGRKWAAELDRVIADLDTMPAPAPLPVNPDVTRLAAEQQEEIRTGIADGLRHGGSFRQIMQEAATYGVKPEEVAAIRHGLDEVRGLTPEQEEGRRMTPEQWADKVAGSIASRVECGYQQPDADGQLRVWDQMTPVGQLGNIAKDSAYWGVSFEAFVSAATQMMRPEALLDAALRVALGSQRKLAAVEMAMPDDGGYGKVSLADRVSALAAGIGEERPAPREHENEGIER